MKRLALIGTLVLMVSNCGESPTGPAGAPSLDISDGAHGGNDLLRFLPPLVPRPHVDDPFDPDAAPTVEICKLVRNKCGPVIERFGPEDIRVRGGNDHADEDAEDEEDDRPGPVDGFYQVNWKTGIRNGVFSLFRYRIQVIVEGQMLGFRDVDPSWILGGWRSRSPDDDFLRFRNGRTIPIRFHIARASRCDDADFNRDRGACAVGNLEDGIVLQIAQTGTGVSIPAQTEQSGSVTLIIEPCVGANGQAADLPIDLPTFGPCFEVRTEPALTAPLVPAATVFICELEGLEFPSHRVENLVTLHRSAAVDGSAPVEALPHAPGLCPTELGAAEIERNWLRQLAGNVGRGLGRLLAPRPLYASGVVLDRGLGGLSAGFSFFQFALPSRMAVHEGDGQTAAPGSAVPVDPAVMVTDSDDEPVPGATVHFEVLTGGGTVVPLSVVSGADGVARVDSWTLGTPGLNALRAFGRGIADPVTNGPLAGFDPFKPVPQVNPQDEVPVTLATGELVFTAEACNGYGSVDVDAVLEAVWDCAQIDQTFTLNVSGDVTAPGRVRILNDGVNLYFAVTITGGPELPPLALARFLFDHDGNAEPGQGEDYVWSRGGAEHAGEVFDAFVSCDAEGCSVGIDAETDTGTNDGEGAFASDGQTWTWEFSHPLASGDIGHDFQLVAGDTVWFSFSVFLGRGSPIPSTFPPELAHVAVVIRAAP